MINRSLLAECKTSDGHPYTGHYEQDEYGIWYEVIDERGNPYQTQEQPRFHTGITIQRFTTAAAMIETQGLPPMKRQTANMFAATNEDLPLFSGMTVTTQAQEFNPPEVVPPAWISPEYSDDGMDGYYKGWEIQIRKTDTAKYRLRLERGLFDLYQFFPETLEDAHGLAEHYIDNHKG